MWSHTPTCLVRKTIIFFENKLSTVIYSQVKKIRYNPVMSVMIFMLLKVFWYSAVFTLNEENEWKHIRSNTLYVGKQGSVMVETKLNRMCIMEKKGIFLTFMTSVTQEYDKF